MKLTYKLKIKIKDWVKGECEGDFDLTDNCFLSGAYITGQSVEVIRISKNYYQYHLGYISKKALLECRVNKIYLTFRGDRNE